MIIKEAQKAPQFIFKNNKVVSVMISPEEYDMHYSDHNTLHEIAYDDMSLEEKKMRDESQLLDKSEYISYTEL